MKRAVENAVKLTGVDSLLWVRSYCGVEGQSPGMTSNSQISFRFPHLVGGPAPAESKVEMTSVPCHFGGTREFFLCPLCSKRVSFLYLERSDLQLNWSKPGHLHWSLQGQGLCCRSCGQRTYQSQRERTQDRSHRKELKIRSQLLARGARPAENAWSLPLKPRGMHWTTYQRSVDEIWRLRRKRDAPSTARLIQLESLLIQHNYRKRTKSKSRKP